VRNYLDEKFGFDLNRTYQYHRFGWTLALGTAPLKLMDLANGYATIATTKNQALCPILELQTLNGEILESPCDRTVKSKLKPSTAYFLSEILSNESARPTAWGWRDKLTLEDTNIAAKTGTSTKRVNGWLYPVDNLVVGFSPKATVFMWAGNASGRKLKPGTVAISSIGATWKTIARDFFQAYPDKYAEFTPPVPLQKINGELATFDYVPPTYEILSNTLAQNKELGLNPLYELRSRKSRELTE
jgi:membrane carboxypeptidase/penicillin-binding protein